MQQQTPRKNVSWIVTLGSFIALATCLSSTTALGGESGFYLGGSVGSVTISADVENPPGDAFVFDEDDFAWKAFGGYNFEIAFMNLAIEGGYLDLGSPSGSFLDQSIDLSATGWDVFALAGIGLGPIDAFVKAGVIAWDVDARIDTVRGSDDGSDPAYGVGAGFTFGSLQIRAEYEVFDIEDTDDVYMLSAGLVWTF